MRLKLSLSLSIESLTVASQEELDSLPFASDFRLEQKVFQNLLQAGFEAAFESRRPALLPQDVYTFFTHTMEKFRSLGRVKISPSLLALIR